jgi:hypothetical protein
VVRRLLTPEQAQFLEDVHLDGQRITEMDKHSEKHPSHGYQFKFRASHNLFLLLSSERRLSLAIPGHQTEPLEVSVDDLWDMIPQIECEKSRAILQFVYLEGNKVSDFKFDPTYTRQKSSRLLQKAQLLLHKKFSSNYPVEIPPLVDEETPYTVKIGDLKVLVESMTGLSEIQLALLKFLYIDGETMGSTKKRLKIWNMKSWRNHYNPALKRLRELIRQEGLHIQLKEPKKRQTRISLRNRALAPVQ